MRTALILCLLFASSNAMAITWVYKIAVHDPNVTFNSDPMRRIPPSKQVMDVIGIPCEFTEANGKFRNIICRFPGGGEADVGIGCDYPGNQPLEMMHISYKGKDANIMLGCEP